MRAPVARLVGPLRQVVRAVRHLGRADETPRAARPATSWSAAEVARYRDLDSPRLVLIPDIEVDAALAATPRVTVLMPHLAMSRMTGGPNTILNLTGRLAALGVPLRFASVAGPTDRDVEALRAHAARLAETAMPPDTVEFQAAGQGAGPLCIGPRDVLIATWWPTAHVARAALAHIEAREFVYLVQDYEPGFYPWSSRHALALASYGFPVRAVVNGRFLLDFLVSQRAGVFGAADIESRAVSFEPAVDRSLFHPEANPRARRRLVFYARPRNERNLFDMGIRALREVAAAGVLRADRWEVVAIGSPIPPLDLGPGLQLESLPWLDYASYAALLRTSDVLLSLMLSPHTSYPPLEMAACGHLVVTNEFGPKTAAALAERSPLIRAAPADPAALAAALEAALGDAEGIVEPMSIDVPGSWAAAFDEALPWLRRAVSEIGGW